MAIAMPDLWLPFHFSSVAFTEKVTFLLTGVAWEVIQSPLSIRLSVRLFPLYLLNLLTDLDLLLVYVIKGQGGSMA